MNAKQKLKNVKAVLFDLDGTVYIDGALIGSAERTLSILREKGITVGFLTNNSSCTDRDYEIKLKNLGVMKEGDFFCSSLTAAAEYLKTEFAGKKFFPVATERVTEYLAEAGTPLADADSADEADGVLLAFDKELTYRKIETANRLIVKGAAYIATHPDKVCPAKDCSVPDVGSFIEMLKSSSGRMPDVIIGKPYPYMARIAAEKLNVAADEMLMVGDRLYTDIAFGVNSGLRTALVLSGETTEEDYRKSNIKADLVLKDVNALADLF